MLLRVTYAEYLLIQDDYIYIMFIILMYHNYLNKVSIDQYIKWLDEQ